MPDLKVTVRWTRNEEGEIPKAERARLLALAREHDITAMDMMQDAAFEVTKLYNEMLELFRTLPS